MANNLQERNVYRSGGYFSSAACSMVPNPASFSGLSSPDLYLYFSIPLDCHSLFRLHFPTVRRMPQTKSQQERGPHLVCFPSLENHSPVTSTAQCLRIVVRILLPSFTAVNGRKINQLFCLFKNWKAYVFLHTFVSYIF